jgi:ketosteroid isomerase-like protein
MPLKTCILIFAIAVLPAGSAVGEGKNSTALTEELRTVEVAFAKTMADRDQAAFARFLADEVVFFTSSEVMRGRDAVVNGWSAFFDGADAPFSWEPDAVAVLESGTLGMTSGPVFDPEGNRIGTFNSMWRRGSDGRWQIVFDRGCPPCECP